jgi:hypothetical protein
MTKYYPVRLQALANANAARTTGTSAEAMP